MPEYLTPGVYIEEIERGPRPIEGVPTSTAAIIGETERGGITPSLVTSYKDYQRLFGSVFGSSKYVPYAASGFFDNGGKRLYVCRIVGSEAIHSKIKLGNFELHAAGPGEWGNRVVIQVGPSSTEGSDEKPIGFRIRLAVWPHGSEPPKDFEFGKPTKVPPSMTEDFDDLVAEESSPDYYGKRFPLIDLEIDSKTNQGPESSALGILVRSSAVKENEVPAFTDPAVLKGGKDHGAVLNATDYVGAETGNRKIQGLSALELDPYRDVALVYAPNTGSNKEIAQKIVNHCETQRFRFAVFDSEKSAKPDSILPRKEITDSSYGAIYSPWIVSTDPKTGARKMVPPGGHVLGVYARSDTERGVFKSPANEVLKGALTLEFDINDNSQGVINPRGVNAIRSFPGRGIRVWGARTLSSNALWKYVSVRRLFLFLERSIYEGTQWVVFENNDQSLWARVSDTIRLFLRNQWKQGALFGASEEEAFFITCDRTTMSNDDILNGRLICEIGIAPVRPAEFVIFRIFQHTADSQN